MYDSRGRGAVLHALSRLRSITSANASGWEGFQHALEQVVNELKAEEELEARQEQDLDNEFFENEHRYGSS